MLNQKRYRLRIIIPAFPACNVYSKIAKTTTALGPICVATTASKLTNWDVEIIDENNCQHKLCPKDKIGLPDHFKLQQERPTDVVGFYGSLTSTVPRIFELAKFYKNSGVKTIVGGKHVENMPEESLDNNIDVVVFGEGEETICELLTAWEKNKTLNNIEGIAYRDNKQIITTQKRELINDFDKLPYPDFGLLRYAKITIYPVSRIRGCNMQCEFCAVKDRARCANPQKMMGLIAYLVENFGARKFFESSDHFAAEREEAIEFCNLLAQYQKEKNIKLKMTVQIRLSDARYPKLLSAMKRAGINNVCIGYESPIDEELISMKKGYLSKDMIAWTKTFHDYDFFIHGMFIFGYPKSNYNQKDELTIKEKIKRFKKFIYRAKLDTVQVVLTVPLPGTALRKRLKDQGRLYDIDWEYYDGQFPLFEPDDAVTPEEMQRAVSIIMSGFYGFHHLIKLILNIVVHFPLNVFPAVTTLLTLRVTYLNQSFNRWKKYYFRNQALRFGGHIIVMRWFKKFKKDKFLEKLKRAKLKLNKQF